MTDVRPDLSAQRLAERYRLLEPLGEGGMALVAKAWDDTLDVPRAVKVLLPSLAKKRSLRTRFEAEAKTMAKLEHPHIVRVYDVGLHGKVPYIAMELLEGGSLQSWVETYGPMPARQAVRVMIDLCGAVAHAHSHGIIHRDIKPHNVLIAADGSVKLTDFGIARTDHGKTKTGAAMGTLGYVAPEQLANAKSATPAADVYSLAVTLWVLVTAGEPERLAYDLDHGALDAVPPALLLTLQAALKQRVEQRTPDVATFESSLRAALEQLPATPEGEAAGRRGVRARHRAGRRLHPARRPHAVDAPAARGGRPADPNATGRGGLRGRPGAPRGAGGRSGRGTAVRCRGGRRRTARG